MKEIPKHPTVDWHGQQVPATLYKYRTWKNQYHKKIITDLQIKMTAPTKFEDELDCRNYIRYDLLTNEQIFQKYLETSRIKNPQFTIEQHFDIANRWAQASPLLDKEGIKQQQIKDFKEYDSRIGILSLTANPSKPKMWTKYAEENNGFCVGFVSDILFTFLGGGGEVIYCKELPTIMPTPWNSEIEQHVKQVYYKTEKWDFEEEYRTTKFSPVPIKDHERVKTLTSNCYKEIIFGSSIDKKTKEQIMRIAKKNMPHIQFKQAKYIDGIVEIE